MVKKFNEYTNENWFNDFKSKLKPKPSIGFWDNGNKSSEIWYSNLKCNKFHRIDGPAIQIWYKNGQKELEKWFVNNKLHREDGLAYQEWNPNGSIFGKSWALNDIEYDNVEGWIDGLKEINSPHYYEQKKKYTAEKYNL